MEQVINQDQTFKVSRSKVYQIGTSPNGLNINDKCGSTFPNKIKYLVKNIKHI